LCPRSEYDAGERTGETIAHNGGEEVAIRAVIFDIGGVLNRVARIGSEGKWHKRLGLSDRELAIAVFDMPPSREASLGQASVDDVWNAVAQRLGLSPAELRDLQADTDDAFIWNTELADYISSLRPRYKTGILSNAWPDARQKCKGYVNSNTFDAIVFSAEEGLMKPEPEIFRRVLARLGVAAHEAIFVDDKQKNVDGAVAIGMHGILYNDNTDVRMRIARVIQVT
jgi:epoxide hydrolase-like predicted phosphatase